MNNLHALTAQLPFDISAEALAGTLLSNYSELADTGKIMIRPVGHVNRVSGREVLKITDAVFNAVGEELVYLDINREGLFDSLPEMLFIRQEESYEDPVEKAQHLARQEERARQFFLPFEETFYRTRIDLEQAERAAIKELADFLLQIYGLNHDQADEKGHRQMRALALILPILHRVVGNLEVTSRLLTSILRKPVNISPGTNQPLAIPAAQQTSLGEGLLGVDLLLGDSFSDGIRMLSVVIGEVHPREVEDWLPFGKQRKLLEERILPYLLPTGEQVTLSIEITGENTFFSLGDTDNEALNILGYTTKIE